jgi:hypothetical protein
MHHCPHFHPANRHEPITRAEAKSLGSDLQSLVTATQNGRTRPPFAGAEHQQVMNFSTLRLEVMAF